MTYDLELSYLYTLIRKIARADLNKNLILTAYNSLNS